MGPSDFYEPRRRTFADTTITMSIIIIMSGDGFGALHASLRSSGTFTFIVSLEYSFLRWSRFRYYNLFLLFYIKSLDYALNAPSNQKRVEKIMDKKRFFSLSSNDSNTAADSWLLTNFLSAFAYIKEIIYEYALVIGTHYRFFLSVC